MIDEKEMMKIDMVTKLAQMLIEDGIAESATEAIDTVINSDTYRKLANDKTGLYYQSTGYVYDFMRNELLTGISL